MKCLAYIRQPGANINIVLLLGTIRFGCCHLEDNKNRTQTIQTSEPAPDVVSSVTRTLDVLLANYNRHLRPGYGGPPTVVYTNVFIRSMGPVSEGEMAYSMNAYFRQRWVDERLKFTGNIQRLALHIKFLDEIWKPDTYFTNGQGSYVHMATTPNKLLRIDQNGSVLYSMRITVKATCPMYLQSFPMDEQSCPLNFGSYAYTNNEVVYKWSVVGNSVSRAEGMTLSQFDLQRMECSVETEERLHGNFSILGVRFHLERQLGYFVIQVYLPCSLVVVLSWVSFWLHREATADRIGLGVTAFLTLITISLEGRGSLPVTDYGTYLDWYFVICFTFVIGSVLEFAGVHYFTKFNYGDQPNFWDLPWKIGDDYLSVREKTETRQKKASIAFRFLMCLQSNIKYKKNLIGSGSEPNRPQINSVSAIDKVARIVFPVSFTAISIMYWVRFYV